ncbi:histone deacetylation protein Rxt3-domain-containing protein [Gaertneriomyces semiglobifer]|nr:histone deacetylation protein Rxt3-domain-containing protein [Gaertneriomyces semiglobifer]
MQSPYQNVTALLQAAQNEFGTRSSDRHGEDDGFGSGQREAAKEAKRRCKPGDVAVVNDERLLRVPRGWRERSLGYVVYKGPTLRHPTSTHPDDIQLFLLPPFGPEHHYATVEVRIPARWLLYRNNVALRKGAVWGTDVYTDDSDVVAVVTHAGWYKCGDDPHARLQRQATPSVKTEPPSTNESVVPSVESRATPAATDGIVDNDAARKEKDRVSSASFPTPPTPAIYRPLAASAALPDHDLIVTLRVLPRLVKYTGSLRNGIHSRGWGGGHDGESIRVEKVEMVERGVEKKGRGNGVKQWLEGE